MSSKIQTCCGCGWQFEAHYEVKVEGVMHYCQGCEKQNAYIDREEAEYYREAYRAYIETEHGGDYQWYGKMHK